MVAPRAEIGTPIASRVKPLWGGRCDLETSAVQFQTNAANPMNVMSMAAASDQEALAASRQAREMFQRTLASWAGDMLEIQRLGLDQARWSPMTGAVRLRRAA